ncbi:hypothetical protein EJ08DRAFT_708751, partial [Tothia fuscella]
LHLASSVSWWYKGDLIFYYDEHDEAVINKPKKPYKPRRRKADTDEVYAQRLMEWEANLPHDIDIKPKGNSMTQRYYTDNVLPHHIKHVERLVQRFGQGYLQEDGDNSHGTRSEVNIAKQLKDAYSIKMHIHPLQSPDLNLIEAV